MVNWTIQQVDAGAEALRQLEQGGKKLRAWDDLPNSTKNLWREKARVVLDATAMPTAQGGDGEAG
jgi:hypothetical protein